MSRLPPFSNEVVTPAAPTPGGAQELFKTLQLHRKALRISEIGAYKDAVMEVSHKWVVNIPRRPDLIYGEQDAGTFNRVN